MAVVELILDVKAPSFVTGNTTVLKIGEPIWLSDGRYSFGDGVTQLQSLTFFGGAAGVPYTGAVATVNLNTQYVVSGGLSIGTLNPILDSHIYIGKDSSGFSNFQNIFLETVAQSSVTNTISGFTSRIGTAAAAFTLPDMFHFICGKGTFGAGSSVTRQYGFFAGNITGATNNYSFYGQSAAATGVWALHMAGTAQNYLAGNLGVGVMVPTVKLQVLATTEQLRLNFDGSNYLSSTVASNGAVSFDAVGSGAAFNFSDPLTVTVNTGGIKLREMVGVGAGSNGIYMGTATPTSNNHILAYDTSNVYLNAPGSNSVFLQVGNNNILRIGSNFIAPTDGINVVLSTGVGHIFATATNQKFSFWGATPIVQPAATTEIGTVLSNIGLRAAGSAYPISTSGQLTYTFGGAPTSGHVLTTDSSGNATWQAPASALPAIVQKTANYTFTTASDEIVEAIGANSWSQTLPTAVGNNKRYSLVNNGTGTITLLTTSGQTVNGAGSGTILFAPTANASFISNGTNWIMLD